jgi:acyl transferase domain-containing protein
VLDKMKRRLSVVAGATTEAAKLVSAIAAAEIDAVKQTPRVQRALQQVGVEPKQCQRCVHYDQDLGREIFQRFPVFRQVAAVLDPVAMSAAQRGEVGPDGQPPKSITRSWNELGGCRHKNLGVFPDSSCEDWE